MSDSGAHELKLDASLPVMFYEHVLSYNCNIVKVNWTYIDLEYDFFLCRRC